MASEQESNSPKLIISPFAFSAISFAALLTILNLSERSDILVCASVFFAVGIPTYVGSISLGDLPRYNETKLAQILAVTLMIIGGLCNLVGLILCFWDISSLAGALFLGSIIFFFFILMAMDFFAKS